MSTCGEARSSATSDTTGRLRANCAASVQRAGSDPARSFRLSSCEPHGEGHRKAHTAAVADLVPDGRAPAGHRARDQAGGRGLLGDERRRLRAALLRRPRGARVARHRPEGRQARRGLRTRPRTTRCRRRTSTCRRSSSPTGARRPAHALTCSTASSPTQSRCGSRSSSSRRASRRRSARPRPASHWPRPPSAGGRELSQRLSKVETAIFRRKTIVFDYYTIGRDAKEKRKVDPYQLLYQRGQFYLIGYSHERDDMRVFRLFAHRGKVSYSSKAEHDFFGPRTSTRASTRPAPTGSSATRWAPRGSRSRAASTG